MRSLIIGMILFLSACNQGSNGLSQADVDAAVNKAITPLQQALAAVTHEQAQEASALGTMQFIGKVHGVVSQDLGRVVAVTNFGPCPDMGLFQGRGGSDSGNPLHSQYEIYKTTNCTSNNGAFTSYNDFTGEHDVPPFVAWDGPNCTGTVLIETDIPQNTYPGAVLTGGVVFKNPVDGFAYWLKGGQTPQNIQIQSALSTSPNSSGCNSDIEFRMVVSAARNDVNQSGIPDSLVPGTWSNVAP